MGLGALAAGLVAGNALETQAAIITLKDHVSDSAAWSDTLLTDHGRYSDSSISATAWTTVTGNGQELSSISLIGTALNFSDGTPGTVSSLSDFSRWVVQAVPMSGSSPSFSYSLSSLTSAEQVGMEADYNMFRISANTEASHFTLQSGIDYRLSLTPETDSSNPNTYFLISMSRGGAGTVGTSIDMYQSGIEGRDLGTMRDYGIMYDNFAYRVDTVTAVPEPACTALIGAIGCAAVAAAHTISERRKKKE